ncbi:MAG TPA: HesA/MoeB/ThiF family protein [Syntrophorhabdaceae bacterium]|nr:HesA/MoeB/ThiF family protein [Syntrophorhabdaceae bacterium]
MKENNEDKRGTRLSAGEKERYTRQIMLPEIGEKGQRLLKAASICIAGIGGLGSVSAYYLVAAGVGHVRIIDRDVVELSNLNRQILHFTGDIGQSKADSALGKLLKLNPHCRVEAIRAGIDEGNVSGMVSGCRVIIDALDNIGTRRVLNAASVRNGILLIYGGVEGLTGMASTFIPGSTACFECLFSHITDEKMTRGVIGALPAVIGSIQALEAIRIIIGQPAALAGKLLYFDGAKMRFHEILAERNPRCVLCGAGVGASRPD